MGSNLWQSHLWQSHRTAPFHLRYNPQPPTPPLPHPLPPPHPQPHPQPQRYVATLEKLSAHSADCGETRIVESSPTYLTGTTSRDASRVRCGSASQVLLGSGRLQAQTSEQSCVPACSLVSSPVAQQLSMLATA